LHRGDVCCRLSVAAGANRGVHEVHEHGQGVRDVRREGSGRADLARLLVGILVVTSPERGQPAGLAGVPLDHAEPTRSRPLDDGIQFQGPPVVSARRRDQGQDQLGRPRQEPVSKLLGDPHHLAVQLGCFVPVAGKEVVPGQHHRSVEPRGHRAALARVADHAPEGLPAPSHPVDVAARDRGPHDPGRVGFPGERRDRRLK
jgi:hypothetical protein